MIGWAGLARLLGPEGFGPRLSRMARCLNEDFLKVRHIVVCGSAQPMSAHLSWAVASPESVADATDSFDAVGDGAQFPPEAANHDVDRVAATVVARAPHLAE